MRYKDLTGMKFDRLTVMGDVGKRTKGNGIMWKCICDCGNEVYVRTYSLGKDVKSCGCLRNEKLIQRSTTHGKKYTRVYREWKNIKQRCLNPKLPDYKYYGARGITICPEWANDFQNFYDWAMANGYSDALTIDRIDNNKNYSPDNCRWVDRLTQSNNTRKNHNLTFNNKTQTISMWARETGILSSTICYRVNHGWSVEEALTIPIQNGGKIHGRRNQDHRKQHTADRSSIY